MRALLSLAVMAAGAAAAQPAKPVAARTQIAQAELGSVKRMAMQAVEKSIDGRIESANPAELYLFRNLATSIPDVEKFSYSMSGAPQSGWTSSTGLKYNNRPKDEDFSIQRKYTLWIWPHADC